MFRGYADLVRLNKPTRGCHRHRHTPRRPPLHGFADICAALVGRKPIGWMNQGHYGILLKKNALDGRLTQQIESYKLVSGGA